MKEIKKMKKINEVALNIHRTWGTFKPVIRVCDSKKKYSRKDKSWKKEF